jgi:hypothetical protein
MTEDFIKTERMSGNERIGPSPEKKWELIFDAWINEIDQKKLTSNLFELKLWFESLEELFSSYYLEKTVFKYQGIDVRNYEFYCYTFTHIISRIINHLKELDFKKDKYLLNFEEFIVENLLERHVTQSFPYMKDIYSPDSWFYGLRIFLQNIKNITSELIKSEVVTHKTFSSIKKLYHKEIMNNSIIISLLRKKFIPKMDKIYQQDISELIASINNGSLKKHIGVFFVFAFRILKINNFIEINLNKFRQINIIVPLILTLKKHVDYLLSFYKTVLRKSLSDAYYKEDEIIKIDLLFSASRQEYNKIFERELPGFFDITNEMSNRRKLLKNIVTISDFAMQAIIEGVLQLFRPEITGKTIFENYKSRQEHWFEIKKKLLRLHSKLNDYFTTSGKINSADIFFDMNVFIETDLNFLPYNYWNEYLDFYNNLIRADFTSEFKIILKSFHGFITRLLKQGIADEKMQ